MSLKGFFIFLALAVILYSHFSNIGKEALGNICAILF